MNSLRLAPEFGQNANVAGEARKREADNDCRITNSLNELVSSVKYRYQYGSIELRCERPLETLDEASTKAKDYWSVSFDGHRAFCQPAYDIVEIWQDPNDVLSIFQNNLQYMVRFNDLADFLIDPISRSIEVYCPAISNNETINHLLLDQVLPRVLAHTSGIVLHAAGVLADGHGVSFLGETGEGKSTLANGFMQADCMLLSDDALLIDLDKAQPTIQALYPCIRLWPESVEGLYKGNANTAVMAEYSSKQRVLLDSSDNITTAAHGFDAAFVLNRVEANHPIQIDPLGQQAACIAFIKNSFQLAPGDAKITKRMFECTTALASRTPVFSLTYPEGYENLPQTMDSVRQHLKSLAK